MMMAVRIPMTRRKNCEKAITRGMARRMARGAASGMECDPPWRMRARRHVCMHLFAFTRVLCVRVRLCLCVRVQRSAQWIARARTRVFVPSPVFISMYVHEPGWR